MEEIRDAIQRVADDGTSFSEVRLGGFTDYQTCYTRRDEESEAAWRMCLLQ
jgi:hypothetical protein